jgi:hypothetical protein
MKCRHSDKFQAEIQTLQVNIDFSVKTVATLGRRLTLLKLDKLAWR